MRELGSYLCSCLLVCLCVLSVIRLDLGERGMANMFFGKNGHFHHMENVDMEA